MKDVKPWYGKGTNVLGSGEVWFVLDGGFCFPVPTDVVIDCNLLFSDQIFNIVKPYIDKHLESLKKQPTKVSMKQIRYEDPF